jgi:endonuclease YncB( thermonuclease family)
MGSVRRRVVFIMLALAAGGVLSVAAGAGRNASATARVTSVMAGDTLQVRLTSGKRQKLHVLGISAPPRGSCFANEAAAATRTLALNQTVKLSGTGAAAYVTLGGG